MAADDLAQLLRRALDRDATALRALIRSLAPVIHVRVARVVERHRAAHTDLRHRRQQIEDFSQEVFTALFHDDARALRGWDPARGMSLLGYVGMIAEQQTICLLRSGRRNPWRDGYWVDDEAIAIASDAPPVETVVATRELLLAVVDRIRAELTPKGLQLFQRLVLDEEPIESVCGATGMTRDAVYAWRSRLGRRARVIAFDLERTTAASDSTAERTFDPEGAR